MWHITYSSEMPTELLAILHELEGMGILSSRMVRQSKRTHTRTWYAVPRRKLHYLVKVSKDGTFKILRGKN